MTNEKCCGIIIKSLAERAAGMLTEFFIASVALIVWANLGGGLAKNLAYNVVIMASVSTVLFNINPLMRFDGYYILTDLLDMPNLQQNSVRHLKYLLERYVFFKRDAEAVAETWLERVIYSVYGVASSIYRIFLFTGFIVTISQHYLILSFIMGALLCLTMVIMPVLHRLCVSVHLRHTLSASPTPDTKH